MAPTIPNYNFSNITNSDNVIVSLFQYTSQQTNYLPGMLILIGLFVVITFALKVRGYRTSAVFTAASSANLVLALMMFPLGIINGQILVVSIALLPLAAFLLWLDV